MSEVEATPTLVEQAALTLRKKWNLWPADARRMAEDLNRAGLLATPPDVGTDDKENGTMTLTEFLLARIAEDEADARWGRIVDDPSDPDSATKILRWDHDRLLAECEAKRRIVELHEAVWQGDGPVRENSRLEGQQWAYERVLHLLALPYTDHPDHRAEWKL